MKKGRKKTVYFRKDYYIPTQASAKRKSSNSANLRSCRTNTKPNLTKTVKSAAVKTKQATAKFTKSLTQKSSSKNPSAYRKVTKRNHQSFSWREVTLMSLIGTSAAMIALTFTLSVVLDPIKRSEQEISKLAERYYIEYLYPRALGDYIDQPKVILRDYAKRGLPNVRLTQLLSYNNNSHANSLDVFENPYYNCDLNATYVKFYPIEPYGPRDFTVNYNMACEKSGSVE